MVNGVEGVVIKAFGHGEWGEKRRNGGVHVLANCRNLGK